ncbi:unnamed protein product [Microthlaspi erraticum]|uniref:Dof zinc finger protein n=1 Tax=Microthlaspi erraticum TaxID=1685480 RepID=A0A6D2JUP3_9BRAS|nr:unnamed protein product [Microthlaspi erraticum]
MLPYNGHNSYQNQFPSPETDNVPGKWKLSYGHEETVAPPCPRCASSNTKFCYYNNYSLSQPRYFCKGCRRYWTKGGSLRNIPVGGGCRKRSRSRHNSHKRFGRSENRSDGLINQDDGFQSSPAGSVIDLAAVFAQYVTDRSPSSTDNTTGSDQDSPVTTTTTTHDALDSLNWDVCQETDPDLGFYREFSNLTEKIHGDERGFDQEEMFEFQGLLDDKEIQEILECSFSEEPDHLISQGSFMINGDNWSSTDLTRFGI